MRTLRHRLRSDEALMLAYRNGDVSAFECLYGRHKDALFAFLSRSCPQPAVVEEVVQETWEAVVNAAAGYEATAKFRTWLFQIGRRRLADYWRRRDNRQESLEDVPEPAAEAGIERYAELERRVMQAIADLPLEQRDALLLREQGFSITEIGDITGAAAETVKSRLRYGRNQLREQLGDEL